MKRRKVNLSVFEPHAPELLNLEEGKDYRVIWLDPENNIFCVVDPDDYELFYHYRWGVTFNSNGKKIYATRNTRRGGKHGPQVRVYMHKEILRRCAPETHPRLEGQNIGDHINGQSLDNRRANLRWATAKENGLNRFRKDSITQP